MRNRNSTTLGHFAKFSLVALAAGTLGLGAYTGYRYLNQAVNDASSIRAQEILTQAGYTAPHIESLNMIDCESTDYIRRNFTAVNSLGPVKGVLCGNQDTVRISEITTKKITRPNI